MKKIFFTLFIFSFLVLVPTSFAVGSTELESLNNLEISFSDLNTKIDLLNERVYWIFRFNFLFSCALMVIFLKKVFPL